MERIGHGEVILVEMDARAADETTATATVHAERVEIPFAGCLMRQSGGVIKCQTNAERESRSGGAHDEW